MRLEKGGLEWLLLQPTQATHYAARNELLGPASQRSDWESLTFFRLVLVLPINADVPDAAFVVEPTNVLAGVCSTLSIRDARCAAHSRQQ